MHISPQVSWGAPNGQGGLRALVRTKDGWAVQHAVATVTDTSGRQTARAEADADGVVVTTPLEPGVYTVVVTAVGYAPAASTAIATSSGSAELGAIVLTRAGTVELPPPGAWTIDPAHSTIAVTAQHLGMSSVHGRFGEFGGRIDIASVLEASTVTAEIKAGSIETGNSMRDDHLRSPDFLDIERYPAIAYQGARLSAAGPDRWTVHGHLTLCGTSRPVDLSLSYLGISPDPWGGTRAAFRAVTGLHRDDFGITFNQVLEAGISLIGATLKVELDVQAVQGESLPVS
jgi:polyisoprenoid-binding protein YceI